MPKGMPSLVALLGLLAVAGFQNRDKIAGALGGLAKNSDSGTPGSSPSGLGGMLSGLGDLFGPSAGGGHVLTGGLGDLLNSFKSAGHGDVADSWVNPDVPTQGLTPDQVEQAVGADNLNELTKRTGLSREELLQRLATVIPAAVDKLTPGGIMPTEADARAQLLPSI